MDTNQLYLQYKSGFVKNAILKLVEAGLALCALLLAFFLPLLQIKLLDYVLFEFSFYDILKVFFKFGSGDSSSTLGAFSEMGNIFIIMGVVSIIAGVIIHVVMAIKDAIGISNPENYALEWYDKIKNPQKEKGKLSRYSNPLNFYMGGIFSEAVGILFLRQLSSSSSSSSGVPAFADLVAANAISWTIVFVILFLVACVVVYFYRTSCFKQIKIAILKEDYNPAKQNTTQNNNQSNDNEKNDDEQFKQDAEPVKNSNKKKNTKADS